MSFRLLEDIVFLRLLGDIFQATGRYRIPQAIGRCLSGYWKISYSLGYWGYLPGYWKISLSGEVIIPEVLADSKIQDEKKCL